MSAAPRGLQSHLIPVAHTVSIKITLAFATKHGLLVFAFDIKTAFLHAFLRDLVYIHQIPGFEDLSNPAIVYKLNRALYGLKQSAYEFYCLLKEVMGELGLHCSHLDRAVFIGIWKAPPHPSIPALPNNEPLKLIIPVHVDDGLATTNSEPLYKWFIQKSGEKMEVVDLGEASLHLGIRIVRDKQQGKMWLSQAAYIEEILAEFGLADCKPFPAPLMYPISKLPMPDRNSLPNVKTDEEVRTLFMRIIGCILWLALATRPDIAYAAMALGQFSANPSRAHLMAARGVLRYLAGTRNLALQYPAPELTSHLKKSNTPVRLETCALSDADWATDGSDKRSVSGYAFYYYDCLVSWSAIKQKIVALSSMEAELYAMCHMVKEALWFRMFLRSCWMPCPNPFPIFADNQSALAMIESDTVSSRSKHIDVRYHFIRDQVVELKTFVPGYIPGPDNTANIFTKVLTGSVFEHHRKFLGLVECPR